MVDFATDPVSGIDPNVPILQPPDAGVPAAQPSPQPRPTPVRSSGGGSSQDEKTQKDEATYRQEVAQFRADTQKQGQDIIAAVDAGNKQQVDLAQQFLALQTPFDEKQPADQIQTVMQGAPWLMALMAFGGKASGMNGLAMMEGLNGMSDGLIKGDQEGYKNSWEKYKASYQKWSDNADRQLRIYTIMKDAYGSATDAKVRAMEAAFTMTNDARQAQLQLDDPERILTINQKLQSMHRQLINDGVENRLREAEIKHYEALTEKDKAAAGGQGGRAEQQFLRVSESSDLATASVKNLMELPVTASAGPFGREETKTIFSATKNMLANKVTSQEVQDYRAMFAGVQRNLATIEASGTATGLVGLSHMMDALQIQEGDTILTKLRKMAEIRQIVEYGTKIYLDDPRVPQALKDHVSANVAEMKKAVPFTNHDITLIERERNPNVTFQDVLEREQAKARQTGSIQRPAQPQAPTSTGSNKPYGTQNGRPVYQRPDGSLSWQPSG